MRALPALAAAAALGLAVAPAQAGGAVSSRYCDARDHLTLADKDRLLRVAGVIREELERSGAEVAIVARTGLELSGWGIRHTHAGISLKQGGDSAWSVRQLYYACDEGQPRIFDQGLSAFLFGADQPALGHVSVVLMPAGERAEAAARAARDNRLALSLLAGSYSANAYAFSTRHQNCNQWLVELLAAGWGGIGAAPDARAQAQRWLAEQRYEPSRVEVGWRPLMWAAATFVTWLHNDDHPEEDLAAAVYRISLPAAVEGLVQAQAVGARRIQFCYTAGHVLVRRGTEAGEQRPDCVAEAADAVLPLD